MIIDYQELNNVLPCKYCGNKPKHIIKYYERDDRSSEINCCGEQTICLFDGYVEVKTTIEEAIDEWNKRNKK